MPEKEKESSKPALKEKIEDISAKKEAEVKKETDSKKDSEEKKAPKTALEEETQKILQMSEISLWLDNYDDIFSDFDPRPYSLRSLSDDFLFEAKKASRDKDAKRLELRFLISQEHRDPKVESTIKKRLRDHFSKHAKLLQDEISRTRKISVILVLLGISMMLGATYVYAYQPDTFTFRFLFVLLEPAGWFTTWFALDNLFYTMGSKKLEYEFYKKMVKCEIMFISY